MKVALLEASHWHVPLYLDPLETTGIEVVARFRCGTSQGTGNCSAV